MLKPMHPLQRCLDRVSIASQAAISLFAIAVERGKTDSAQAFLYRAVIASSMAALEEYFEDLPTAFYFDLPERLKDTLDKMTADRIQSTSAENFNQAMLTFGLPRMESEWTASLEYCGVKPTGYPRSDGLRLELHGVPAGSKEFSGKELGRIIDRFSKIRNEFAHQDRKAQILTPNDREQLRQMSQCDLGKYLHSIPQTMEALRGAPMKFLDPKSLKEEQRKLIEELSTCVFYQLYPDTPQKKNAISRVAVHGRHAKNSIRLVVGVAASIAAFLATELEKFPDFSGDVYNNLTLKVLDGEWRGTESIESFGNTVVAVKPNRVARYGALEGDVSLP